MRRMTTHLRRMMAWPVGERIRHARLHPRDRSPMTQEELAEAIGAHDRIHIIKWENGSYRPRKRLSDGVPYRDLLAEATGYPAEFFEHDGVGGRDE